MRINASDATLVLVDRQLADFLDPRPGDPPIELLDEVFPTASGMRADAYERPADDPYVAADSCPGVTIPL